MKIILNSNNRYIGAQLLDFPLAPTYRIVEVDDAFGAQLNDLWYLDGDTWRQDSPPPHPVMDEPVFAQPPNTTP